MGKFDGWLFISDIDGTLLSAPNYTLSSKNKEAITTFINEGGRFTFASGRCLFGLMGLYRELGLKDPVIASNGSMIYDPARDVFPYVAELDPEKSLAIYQYAKERLPDMGFEIFTDRIIYFIDDNEVVQNHIRAEQLPYPFVTLDAAKEPWTKLVFAILPSEMQKSREVIFSAPTADTFCITQSMDCYLELSQKNVTKGSSVLKLADLLGIDTNHIITLGDNENDVSMFEITPYSFAVADGSKIAKHAAAFQTGPGGSAGEVVAEVLNQLF